MSRRSETPAEAPQPNTVIAEPATVEACRADYADRNNGRNPAGHITATPHTYGRR